MNEALPSFFPGGAAFLAWFRDLMRGEGEHPRQIFENSEPNHLKKGQIAFEHPQL